MLMINYILGLTGTLNVMLWRNSIFGLELSMLWAWLCLMMSLEQNKIQTTTFTYPFDLFMVNTEVWMINLFWLLFKSNPWPYFVSQTINKFCRRSVKLVLTFFFFSGYIAPFFKTYVFKRILSMLLFTVYWWCSFIWCRNKLVSRLKKYHVKRLRLSEVYLPQLYFVLKCNCFLSYIFLLYPCHCHQLIF